MTNDEKLVAENEILLIDKPEGISSFGVVSKIRHQLSEEAGYIEVKGKDGVVRQKRKKVKVGHTGTLDPFATGLLILLVGKGTKRAGEFLKLDKEYIATVRLGEVSTTGDREGEIVPYGNFGYLRGSAVSRFGEPLEIESPCGGRDFDPTQPGYNLVTHRTLRRGSPEISQGQSAEISIPAYDEVEKVVAGFVGEIEQQVPVFSAVKIHGQRAYKLAREGKTVEMPVRKVKIYEIEILRYEWPELEIRCKVSSGTYIRALGEDIGIALGVGGYLTQLRRTQVGKYRVEDAQKISVDIMKRK